MPFIVDLFYIFSIYFRKTVIIYSFPDEYDDDSGVWKLFKPLLSGLNLPDRPKPYTPFAYKLLRNHPVLLMSQCNQEKLMSHPLCKALRKAKFRSI